MTPRFVRTIRTETSERYLLQDDAGCDEAALDLHFLSNGRVAGTMILLPASKRRDEEIAELLKHVDEVLLPDVSFEEGNLSFTVVRGELAGSYVAVKDGD